MQLHRIPDAQGPDPSAPTPPPLTEIRRESHSLSRTVISGATAALDIGVVVGLGYVIFLLYEPDIENAPSLYLSAMIVYATLLALSFRAAGLYGFDRIIKPLRQATTIASLCFLIFLSLIAIAFGLKVSAAYSRVWVFSWLFLMIPTLFAGRLLMAATIRRLAAAGRFTRNILIYAGDVRGRRLLDHVQRLDEPWNKVIGIFDQRSSRLDSSIDGIRVVRSLDDLVEFGRHQRVDEILIALPWDAHARVSEVVHAVMPLPTNIRLSPGTLGLDLPHYRVSNRFGVPMLSVAEKPVSGWGAVLKPVLDVTLSAFSLVLCMPLFALIAAAIKIESPGPVFFVQQRYGFNNGSIKVLKFRTMRAERLDVDASKLTTRDDPRLTKVGKLLRRLSFDELPQLINVLRGEMSIVGPRPHAFKASAGGRLYDEVVDDYALRHKVKPGITGWAQVNGWRGNTETEEDIQRRVEHDLYYIENWSLLFDLYIIARTVVAVVVGKNAY